MALAIEQSPCKIVIDLRAADYIANPELALLVRALLRVTGRAASIAIVGGDPRLREVVSEVGLDGIRFTTTIAAALTTLKAHGFRQQRVPTSSSFSTDDASRPQMQPDQDGPTSRGIA